MSKNFLSIDKLILKYLAVLIIIMINISCEGFIVLENKKNLRITNINSQILFDDFIIIVFDTAINTNFEGLVSVWSNYSKVALQYDWSADNKQLTITTTNGFKVSNKYNLIIKGNYTDVNLRQYYVSNNIEFYYKLKLSSIFQLISIKPQEEKIDKTSPVSFTFSEAINEKSIDGSIYISTLETSKYEKVLSSDKKTITITPTNNYNWDDTLNKINTITISVQLSDIYNRYLLEKIEKKFYINRNNEKPVVSSISRVIYDKNTNTYNHISDDMDNFRYNESIQVEFSKEMNASLVSTTGAYTTSPYLKITPIMKGRYLYLIPLFSTNNQPRPYQILVYNNFMKDLMGNQILDDIYINIILTYVIQNVSISVPNEVTEITNITKSHVKQIDMSIADRYAVTGNNYSRVKITINFPNATFTQDEKNKISKVISLKAYQKYTGLNAVIASSDWVQSNLVMNIEQLLVSRETIDNTYYYYVIHLNKDVLAEYGKLLNNEVDFIFYIIIL